MLDLTTVILTYNEERHIRRCLERVRGVGCRVIVVDSDSTDRTCEIAREMGAEVVNHRWPGCQAAQFNWALDNLEIRTEWILRLDADEYLTDELKGELDELLPTLGPDISAISIPLGRAFMGRRLKHGIVNDVEIVRLFRNGRARYEQRIMDEHLSIETGNTLSVKNKFVDDSRLSIGEFVNKHVNYASREAVILVLDELNVLSGEGNHSEHTEQKRAQKARYGRMPLLWRAFGYFCYRYFFKMGFLDGKEGFLWDFMQGWWYRTLVDAKVMEIKRACGSDVDKIKKYVRQEYGVEI